MMMPDESRRSPSQRLPVNPRRHKVAPEQRKRVATACNGCNVRRIKCSGERPCRQCASSSRECVYPTAVEKVSLTRNELDDLKAKLEIYEKALQDAIPDAALRQDILLQLAASPAPSTSPGSSAASHRQSFEGDVSVATAAAAAAIKMEPAEADQAFIEGRLLQDPKGAARFLGETSHATFMDHLKEFVATALPMTQQTHQIAPEETSFLASMGRYRTSDSRPFHDLDVDPLWLPPNNNLSVMLSELRHFIQDGNGEWSSGGIYWWGDFTSVPMRPSASQHDDDEPDLTEFRHLAFYHAALAVTCQSASNKPAMPSEPLVSESYFARASLVLENPLNISRGSSMGDVGTLALLGFYLISMDRPETAAMYVTAAARISVMHGAHRGWADEAGKRLFWTVYVLDRWVSCLLGRPPVIVDDSIRLAPPSDAPSMPPAAGLRAHVELSRISGHIVHSTQRLTPGAATAEDQSQHLQKTTWLLSHWDSSLPASLQLGLDGLTADPAAALLHMQRNQLLMLAARPLFFAAVKRSFAERVVTQRSSFELHPQAVQLQSCVSAARQNMRLARHLATLGRRGKLPHSSLQFLMDAAIVLLLHELAADEATPTEEEGEVNTAADVEFVLQRLDEEARVGSVYGRDEAATLRLLRGLLARLKLPMDPGLVPAVMGAEFPQPQFQMGMGEVGESEGVYEDLATWMDGDWPMYDGGYLD